MHFPSSNLKISKLIKPERKRRQSKGRRKQGRDGEGRNETEPEWNRTEQSRIEMG